MANDFLAALWSTSIDGSSSGLEGGAGVTMTWGAAEWASRAPVCWGVLLASAAAAMASKSGSVACSPPPMGHGRVPRPTAAVPEVSVRGVPRPSRPTELVSVCAERAGEGVVKRGRPGAMVTGSLLDRPPSSAAGGSTRRQELISMRSCRLSGAGMCLTASSSTPKGSSSRRRFASPALESTDRAMWGSRRCGTVACRTRRSCRSRR